MIRNSYAAAIIEGVPTSIGFSGEESVSLPCEVLKKKSNSKVIYSSANSSCITSYNSCSIDIQSYIVLVI